MFVEFKLNVTNKIKKSFEMVCVHDKNYLPPRSHYFCTFGRMTLLK